MTGQSVLALVKKPYKLAPFFVWPINVRTKLKIPVKALHYLFADQAGVHDIFFEDRRNLTHSSLYSQDEVVLQHDSEDADEDGVYPTRYTPIVPSATIIHDQITATIWLTKQWFGDEEMERRAEEVIGSICEEGCVIFDYEQSHKHGTLAHVDTNMGRYVLPASYLDPYFLDLSCFRTEVKL